MLSLEIVMKATTSPSKQNLETNLRFHVSRGYLNYLILERASFDVEIKIIILYMLRCASTIKPTNKTRVHTWFELMNYVADKEKKKRN